MEVIDDKSTEPENALPTPVNSSKEPFRTTLETYPSAVEIVHDLLAERS